MFNIIRSALNLNIYDVNHYFGTADPERIDNPGPSSGKPGVSVRIGSFMQHFMGSFRKYRTFPSAMLFHHSELEDHNSPGPIIFLFNTLNQKSALLPVYRQTQNALLIGMDFIGKVSLENSLPFPVFKIYLISFFFLPWLLFQYLFSKGYQRKSYRQGFDSYWLVYGSYILARLWFRKLMPAGLVVSSDHSGVTRAFALAAKHEGISTFYLQHASVTEKFPPLSFDYAFLEGWDAFHKYQVCGPSSTKVFLVGNPKFDHYVKYIHHQPNAAAVGICINMFDPIERVEQVCFALHRDFPKLELSLRPHPADRRVDMWRQLSEKHGAKFSDSHEEISFEFLRRVDVIIAGSSNIHLEAAIMNVVPIYYDFAQNDLDWYGFRKQGLVQSAQTIQDLIDIMGEIQINRPAVRMKAKHYCATIGTGYDGKSSKLAANLLGKLVIDGSVDQTWSLATDQAQEVYVLVE
jgi:hypothetical protein